MSSDAHDELLARARAYVREHRATYTDEALRERMLADGVPADVVDRALGDASPYGAPDAAPSGAAGPAARPRAWLVWLAVVGVSLVTNVAVILTSVALFWNSESVAGFLLTCAAGLAAECAAAAAYARKKPGMSSGIVVAVALAPVVAAALLLGGCFAILVVSLSGHH